MSEPRVTYPIPAAPSDLRELVALPERVGEGLAPADIEQALSLARALSGCPRVALRLAGRPGVSGELTLPAADPEESAVVGEGGERALVLPLKVALSPEGVGLARRFGSLGVGPLPAGEPPAAEPLAAHVATLLVERAVARRGGTDRVTGLLSRPAFERGLPLLTERIARGERLALAILDVDGLREVNARGGVAAGDELLSGLGAAVAAAAGAPELACRWGGDELVLVLPGRDAAGAQQALKGLLQALAGTGPRAGSFASGVACAPEHARDAAGLLFHADQALAEAKRQGPGRVAVWDESLRGSRGRDLVGSVLTGSPARDYRHVQALLEALTAVSHLRPLPEALGALLDRALDVTGADRGLVLLETSSGEGYDVAAARGRGGAALAPGQTNFAASIVSDARREGHAVHRVAEEGAAEISPSAEAMGLRAVLCAPLGGEDVPAGAVYLDARDPARFDPPTLLLFDALVSATTTALRNAALHDKVRARAERLAAEANGREAELVRVRRQLERGRERDAGQPSPERYQELVGSSSPMRELFGLLRSLEGTEVPVVIEGESGTGKELVARAIHARSPRAKGPMIAVNCGAIPETLVESELFGHVRGSFTGAQADRPGLIEAADGGTLFLDELGELPLDAQAKLLRVLESGELRRVGESHTRSVDVRVVAATNRDLRRAIAEETFREDLFYRLAVFRLRIPPLRERPQDVPMLVQHLLRSLGRPDAPVAPETMRALVARRWPGNVRELRNVLERALALAGRGPILPEHVPEEAGPGADEADASDLFELPLQSARALFSLRYARRAIERSAGSVPEAARRSGVSRQTFYRVIAEGERLLTGEGDPPPE